MIKINLKDTFISEKISKFQKKVNEISKNIEKKNVEGSDFLGWLDLPNTIDKKTIEKINKIAKKLKSQNVEALVVVGIGGSFAGTKAGIEMILGELPNKKKNMEIIYIGESISSTNLVQKLMYLETKNFAINVISKSGTTLEPAIAFKMIKKLLEKKIGLKNANELIIATTDANKGVLLKQAKEKNYTTFVIPDNVGGRFSVLTPVGLLPLACAGINIEKILKGAKKGNEKYSSSNLDENLAYQYAVARFILSEYYPIELMVQFEPQMKAFSEWWKQLAGESEGKNEKGIFPASATFSTDLHSLGQFIQEGSKVLFETMIFVKNPTFNLQMFQEEDNLDQLNAFSKLTVHQMNKTVFEATVKAHNKIGKTPVIEMILEDLSPQTFGELVIFFERAVMMTSYLMEINPFNQPGVEIYKQNMFKILNNLI